MSRGTSRLGLWILSALVAGCTEQSPVAGGIESPPEVSFGVVDPHETVSHTFRLHNHHPFAVTIDSIRKSCSCLRVSESPGTKIVAGQSADLLVTYTPSVPGPNRASIRLTFDSGEETTLSLAGSVRRSLVLVQDSIRKLDVAPGETLHKAITFSIPEELRHDLELVDLCPSSGLGMQIELGESVALPSQAPLVKGFVHLTVPEDASGLLRGKLTLGDGITLKHVHYRIRVGT